MLGWPVDSVSTWYFLVSILCLWRFLGNSPSFPNKIPGLIRLLSPSILGVEQCPETSYAIQKWSFMRNSCFRRKLIRKKRWEFPDHSSSPIVFIKFEHICVWNKPKIQFLDILWILPCFWYLCIFSKSAVCLINKVLQGFDELLESHIQAINWDDCNRGQQVGLDNGNGNILVASMRNHHGSRLKFWYSFQVPTFPKICLC